MRNLETTCIKLVPGPHNKKSVDLGTIRLYQECDCLVSQPMSILPPHPSLWARGIHMNNMIHFISKDTSNFDKQKYQLA